MTIRLPDLPEDDIFAELDEMPEPADAADLLGWFMSVTLNYSEACRRMATNEDGAFELLIGTYNATIDTVHRVAVTTQKLMKDRGV